MRGQTYIQRANVAVQAHKKPVSFKQKIPAGGNITLAKMVEGDCTLENVYIKFYGSQHLLQVDVKHERRGTQIANSVFDYVGYEQYMSGDFEDYDEPTSRALQYKDYLIVRAVNNDTKEATLNVVLSLDFYGGGQRVIGG